MTAPVITFLSDYGLEDDFVGVCHGVIAAICPQAHVIDLTHGIARHDVRRGAVVLEGALRFLPVGVHLAVVDPGVGGERRAVGLRLGGGGMLVGPDNGLLWPAAQAGGGVVEAVDIGGSQFRLEPVSATFHGRDIFAPVAGQLACGAALASAGEPLDPGELVRLELLRAAVSRGELIAHALYIDRFGNVQLDAGLDDIGGAGFRPGERVSVQSANGGRGEARYVGTFTDVDLGQLLLYEDSYRRLALAVRDGSAASRLGISVDEEIRVSAG
jgi:S-adenosylmethionine hydrolase